MGYENTDRKLMLILLGGIAQFEREMMLERQKEGVAKAKAAGRYKALAKLPYTGFWHNKN